MKKNIKILFSVLTLIIIFSFIFNGFKKEKLLIKFYGISALVVSSGSMKPELAIGDIIIIKEFNEYNQNDIITFNVNDEYLVTHRIIEKQGNNFVTKGDNNTSRDEELVKKENIVGKVIYNSKILKIIYEYWFLIIIVVILLLLIF